MEHSITSLSLSQRERERERERESWMGKPDHSNAKMPSLLHTANSHRQDLPVYEWVRSATLRYKVKVKLPLCLTN
jgi:hypothetical protein